MQRPSTPHIEISQNNCREQSENEKILKNFSNFMKQVIDKQNDIFLNGEKNVVKYILAKYLQVPYEEISSIKKISIKINNDYGLLNQFGQFLPSLMLLKLNNSNIITMNNLGTSFTQLICLQMNRCFLRDLSGIICLQYLKILDVKCNQISDLIELEMSNLEKINLNSNLIDDFDNLTFLSGMDDLEWVNLANNPICEKSEYREQLSKYLPNVEKIDLDEDIVAMFDEDSLNNNYTLSSSKPKVNGFIISNNKQDEKIVNELNQVLEMNNDANSGREIKEKEDDIRVLNEEDNKNIFSPIISSNQKQIQHHQRCLAHHDHNYNHNHNHNQLNQNDPDKEKEKEKKNLFKFNNSQRLSNNILKKQITKYQIDANDAFNKNTIANNNNNGLLRSCKEHQDNLLRRDRNELDKDNSIITYLNNTTKSQIKRGNSLNSLKKTDKDKYAITAKPLLEFININKNAISPLKTNRGGEKGKILLLKKE